MGTSSTEYNCDGLTGARMEKPSQLKAYDAAEYLRDEESIAMFLQDAMESGDERVIRESLGIAARARRLIAMRLNASEGSID